MCAKNLHNKTYLKDTRRNLRNNLTSAKATLWTLIKNKQLLGRKVRRQHSIGNFIVDFYCPSENLVLEIDGGIHNNPGVANSDFERDKILNELGFKVCRIENDLVFEQSQMALDLIVSFFSKELTTPDPSLKKGGELELYLIEFC